MTDSLIGTCPSFTARRIEFPIVEYHALCNPSVAVFNGQIISTVRGANHWVNDRGGYLDRKTGVPESHLPKHNYSYLARFSDTLGLLSVKPIIGPDFPPSNYRVTGVEDCRLFVKNDGLWVIAATVELNPHRRFEQIIARIDENETEARLVDWSILAPRSTGKHEKNWMVLVDDPDRFYYKPDSIRNPDGTITPTGGLGIGHMFGTSQAIPFAGGRLAILHTVSRYTGRRVYWHYFVRYDADGVPQQVSPPFVFESERIEFASGLATHPDGERLIISYGREDSEAWLALVDIDEVLTKIQWGTKPPYSPTNIEHAQPRRISHQQLLAQRSAIFRFAQMRGNKA